MNSGGIASSLTLAAMCWTGFGVAAATTQASQPVVSQAINSEALRADPWVVPPRTPAEVKTRLA